MLNFEEGRPVEILSVEDNPGDARLIAEMFKLSRLPHRLTFLADGAQAMKYLNRDQEYHNAPTPDLILLDLNLPRRDGRDVLKEIKADPTLSMIPVLILTTSDNSDDIIRCYQLHCNSYLTKPSDLKGFAPMIRAIEDFWLTVAELPSGYVSGVH